jgi:hypothetical protein
MLDTWDIDWETIHALSIPIDSIPNKKEFVIDGNDMATLIEGAKPMTNREVLLIKKTMVELTTLVIMLDKQGGKIPRVTIVEVGVIGTPKLDTCEVSSIATQ